MTMLNLLQQRPQVKSELSRRIGYTNGLHDIYRFARVVNYLYSIAPASVASLRSIILEQEDVRGTKYADGVIDVARALGLIHKAGTKLTPSDKGYALYAVQHMDDTGESTRALLLHSVLESDGEATLNLLDLLANAADSTSLGELLVDRLLRILELRECWAKEEIGTKAARDMVLQELSDSKRRLATAVDIERKQNKSWSAYREERRLTAEQRVNRFYTHTVNPRRRWLKDLGCVREQERHQYHVTEMGCRILASFKRASCYSNSVFMLPISIKVAQLLGVATSGDSKDLFWRATASSFEDTASPAHSSPDEHLTLIARIYPYVKFHLFNEAAIESIHDAMGAQLAANGQYVERDSFDGLLEATFKKFPDKVYRLRQRHGGSGYIAMKSNVGDPSSDADR